MIGAMLTMVSITILQNASYTLVSRARNTRSYLFHTLAAICSNGMYLLVIRQVVTNLSNIWLMLSYLTGSVIGSVLMHWISMTYLEKRFKTHIG